MNTVDGHIRLKLKWHTDTHTLTLANIWKDGRKRETKKKHSSHLKKIKN